MRAVVRLNLLVAAAFLLALLLSLYALMHQARSDIRRELSSSMRMAEQLLTQAVRYPEQLESLLQVELRHLSLQVLPTGVSPHSRAGGGRATPAWFQMLVWPDDQPLFERRIPLNKRDMLILFADPSDELEEVWESALQMLWLFLGAALLSSAAITWGVGRGMRPVGQILQALDRIQQGQFNARLGNYSVPEVRRLANHFNRMAEVLEHEQADNRRLTRELMALQEKERSYLARELHDDLGQYLTGIRAQAYLLSKTCDRADLVEKIAPLIVRDCEQIQQGFRRLVRNLHPVILEPLGLEESLRSLTEQWQRSSGIECQLSLQTIPALPDQESATHLYRLLQEALNNVARHAQATRVCISLIRCGSHLSVRVQDNGQGFPAGLHPGVGLRSMQERARYMNAVLELVSVTGEGLLLKLDLPLCRGVKE